MWVLVRIPALCALPFLFCAVGFAFLATKLMNDKGSGIGLESALTFAERGSRAVVFADLDLEAAQAGSEKSKSLATAKDYETLAVVVDVRDRASVKGMVKKVQETYGKIDYAVNCAGVSGSNIPYDLGCAD